ncbi:MAG: hypothetical protein ABFC77_09120 [Thermoguttaceae bacterium]
MLFFKGDAIMLIASILFFAIAAVGGVVLAAMRLKNQPMPASLAMTHGSLAATGVVLLLIAMAVCVKCSAVLAAALILFLVAAAGGVFMAVAFSMRKRTLPIPLMLAHGSLAVIAFLLLLSRVVGV